MDKKDELYWYQKGIEDSFEDFIKFQPEEARKNIQPFISMITDNLISKMQLKQKIMELEGK